MKGIHLKFIFSFRILKAGSVFVLFVVCCGAISVMYFEYVCIIVFVDFGNQ